jgi:hypothetical protein
MATGDNDDTLSRSQMQKYVHTYKEASVILLEYCNERKKLCVEGLDEYMRACESIIEVNSKVQGVI